MVLLDLGLGLPYWARVRERRSAREGKRNFILKILDIAPVVERKFRLEKMRDEFHEDWLCGGISRSI